MVFESVVVDVLNRFLGDYVENLDRKQLQIGIWGGDVVLKNLTLKQSALKDLDLPIQTVYGRLENLVIKIPWKNLYGSAVEVSIEGLYLVLKPNNEVKYNEEKEEKRMLDAKLAKLHQMEDAKKKKEPKTDDSFVEKLVTQIVKNVQLSIKKIHVRYEESQCETSYAMGVTLSNLTVQTTNEDWKPTIIAEEVTKIYKILNLEGLAVYWNSNAKTYSDMEGDTLGKALENDIANKEFVPDYYNYILRPINSFTRLILNPKPESNVPVFLFPKVHAELIIENLSLGISRLQYQDIIDFADSMNQQSVGMPYRKYRPDVPSYKGFYKEWWQFAYRCVLETEVKRKRMNWDWQHMCSHRNMCSNYRTLYKDKKTGTKKGKDVDSQLNELEKKLDLVNLVLIRQRIDMELEKLDKMVDSQKSKGWFSGWWGKSDAQAEQDIEDSKNILSKFQQAMTREEKEKLFKAIDYTENTAPLIFPEKYVDMIIKFHLQTFEINMRNDELGIESIMRSNLSNVKCHIERRPFNNGLKIALNVERLTIYGMESDDVIPEVVTSQNEDSSLLDFSFEINPIDIDNGQRVHLAARPLKIIYDAETIKQAINLFVVPTSSALQQLSQITAAKLNNLKEMSAAGIQHVIDQHTILDLNIQFSAPYILIPYRGKYTGNENMLVLNLGFLSVTSENRKMSISTIRKLYHDDLDRSKLLNEMISQSYDKFNLELMNIQILMAQTDENWMQCILDPSEITPMHILTPLNLRMGIETCLISNDPNLPALKIKAEMPSISINVTDTRLLLLLGLVNSLALDDDQEMRQLSVKSASSLSLTNYLDSQVEILNSISLEPKSKADITSQLVQLTQLQGIFILKEITIKLSHQDTLSSPINDILVLQLNSIKCTVLQQTYNMSVRVSLESISMDQYVDDDKLGIISTPLEGADARLIDVQYSTHNKKSPEFYTLYGGCASVFVVNFSRLQILLKENACKQLILYSTEVSNNINEIMNTNNKKTTRRASQSSITSMISIDRATYSKRALKGSIIILKIVARLGQLTVTFESDTEPLSLVEIKGLSSEVEIRKAYIKINASLNSVRIMDLNPVNLNNQIVSVDEDEKALVVQVVLFNEKKHSHDVDLAIKAKSGCIRIIYVNWYITNMLNFLNQFQEARVAISDASEKAAHMAKENMQNLYSEAKKITLDINLKAPMVIIPESSQTYNCLVIDLGYIILTNKISELDIKNAAGDGVFLDQLMLKMQDLKMVRHFYVNGVKHAVSLVEPITVSISIIRNLSSAWYRSVPDVDVDGNIDTIQLLLAAPDYHTIMNIVNINLAEGTKHVVTTTPIVMVDESRVTRELDEFGVIRDEDDTERDELVTTTVQWNFVMKRLKINLLTEETEYDGSRVRRDLGEFSLEGLSIRGRLLSNNSVSNALLLLNCLIKDTRPERKGEINCLLSRTEGEDVQRDGTTSNNMIDITFQHKFNDTFVDIRVFSFTFILSVEYLMLLSNFFTIASDTKPIIDRSLESKSFAREKSVSKMDNKPETMLSVTLKLEKPNIILVENIDTVNTRAMILNSEVLIKMRTAGTHQNISGLIKDVQMYTCIFDPQRRAETRKNVLAPTNITIAGSTPDDRGLHIEVYVSNIYISVSLHTMELISNILATLSPTGKDDAEVGEVTDDYSTLWDIKENEKNEFWFLKAVDTAYDALEFKFTESRMPAVIKREQCILNARVIVITLEAGVGKKTFPMLLLESGIEGRINDWSSQLYVDTTLHLQMWYYNSLLALWEPLIDPIQNPVTGKLQPWELRLEVSKNEVNEEAIQSPSDNEGNEVGSIQANMSIDISSSTNLEITVTKTSLEVLTYLGKLFSASNKEEFSQVTQQTAYKVINNTGLSITLLLNKSKFFLYDNTKAEKIYLKDGAEADVDYKAKDAASVMQDLLQSLLDNEKKPVEKYLHILVEDSDGEIVLPVIRADTRYFRLTSTKHFGRGLVSSVKVDDGITIITLSSIIQVHNAFYIPIDMYYMLDKGNEVKLITTIEPQSAVYVPMQAVYSQTSELFFSLKDYSITTAPFAWKDLQLSVAVSKNLTCVSKDYADETFVIHVIGEMSQIYFENTTKHTMLSTIYNIHLCPAVVLKNCLPIDIVLCVQNIAKDNVIHPGDSLEVPNVEPGKTYIVIRIPNYLEKEWSCQHEITSSPQQFTVWTFESHDCAIKMSLDLGIHNLIENGSLVMTLYCPFWMLNKTGFPLCYRSSDENLNILHHPPLLEEPILFSFNAKNFFGKKKACVKIQQGEWSDKFSIDVAGSSGIVICKNDGRLFQLGVSNRLTYNGLTKQIIFTPYFVIINHTNLTIECQELDRPADPWLRIMPKSCCSLWPYSEKDDKLIKLRIFDTDEITSPFLITESHTTLLKLDNQYGGLNVDIQLSEGAIYINLALYDEGMAPARIINNTKHTLNFWEKESIQLKKLPPNQNMFYTWDNPSGQRVLVWEGGYKKELEDDLRMDGIGNYQILENEHVYWVSFLDGMQRILLLTSNMEVAENAQTSKQFEIVDKEITVSIYGLGLSIVNNVKRQEVMYVGIASTGIIWEISKLHSKRFKQMSTKDNLAVEKVYEQYSLTKEIPEENENKSSKSKTYSVEDRILIDFENEAMLKPHKRKIRRRFQVGLWIQMRSSQHQMQLHAKVNRLQIDNQLFEFTFPVVLAPVPPPKSISNNAHKPFAELSIVQLTNKNSQIQQFKYFKILVQEFHVKVDLVFINALMEVLHAEQSEKEIKEQFLNDLTLNSDPLYKLVSTHSMAEKKNFYDLLHFSPLKIHVSFSMSAGAAGSGISSIPVFLSVLLQGIGVTLTDLQDVIFKLAYFEREYSFLTKRQLTQEATTHYLGQTVKQLYVLVLGLDVIGNPYGLVVGISKGVEDLFYEPFQGAIQGPGEFAEGLVLGMRSLLGHTVGGAAGAVSRITGAMGKGIAALTFDKDYQRKRREQINKRPATVQEGMARGGKGLVMGVVDGVTGVFTKPISGAKEQGVGGFFKGLGKGAVGLVTRPTAGVMDFASTSFETVKRVTDFGHEEVSRLRPSRFVQADCFVRPYNEELSIGNKILCELEKGKYSTTDIYSCHVTLVKNKEILLFSDKRLALIMHNDLFGGWQVEWSTTWQDMDKQPMETSKGVVIYMESKRRTLFHSTDTTKTIPVNDATLKSTIMTKITQHMMVAFS